MNLRESFKTMALVALTGAFAAGIHREPVSSASRVDR
jgi:hypothetical protein